MTLYLRISMNRFVNLLQFYCSSIAKYYSNILLFSSLFCEHRTSVFNYTYICLWYVYIIISGLTARQSGLRTNWRIVITNYINLSKFKFLETGCLFDLVLLVEPSSSNHQEPCRCINGINVQNTVHSHLGAIYYVEYIYLLSHWLNMNT